MNWWDKVIEHLSDPLLDPYRDRLIYIGAQGSQNHATLATPNSDMDTVALIMNNMDSESQGKILAEMDPDFAASVTKKLLP